MKVARYLRETKNKCTFIQKPEKTLTYNGMKFDKSQGTVGIEMYMNSVHLQLT